MATSSATLPSRCRTADVLGVDGHHLAPRVELGIEQRGQDGRVEIADDQP